MITQAQKTNCHYFLETKTNITDVAARLQADVTLAEQIMRDAGLACCPNCEWWTEIEDLIDDKEEGVAICSSCRME